MALQHIAEVEITPELLMSMLSGQVVSGRCVKDAIPVTSDVVSLAVNSRRNIVVTLSDVSFPASESATTLKPTFERLTT